VTRETDSALVVSHREDVLQLGARAAPRLSSPRGPRSCQRRPLFEAGSPGSWPESRITMLTVATQRGNSNMSSLKNETLSNGTTAIA